MFDNNSLTHIEYLSPILHELLKLGVYLVTSEGLPIISYTKEQHKNPLAPCTSVFFQYLLKKIPSNQLPLPRILTTTFKENFVVLPLYLSSHATSDDLSPSHYWLFGPSAYAHLDTQELESLFTPISGVALYGLSVRRKLHNFQNSLPILDYQKLLRLSQLLCFLNSRATIDISELFDISNTNELLLDTKLKTRSLEQRMHDFRHHTLEPEQRMLTCVRTGNVNGLVKMLEFPLDGEYGILSKNNALRGQKNLQICTITLATRAAIEGGLNTELALTLSDLMIQTIESLQDIPSVAQFYYQSLLDLTKRVAQIRQQNHTKPILITLDYIEQHLDQCLTLQDVAAKVSLSPHYLSDCFKAEMNITFRDYVQRRKIEEAKLLMASPTYSLLEISTSLGFHDQSHFTKMFKKWTGTTPKQFKA